MTSKQCNSRIWHIYVKKLEEHCFLLSVYFFKNKNCPRYENGKINQGHKDFFKKLGIEYSFTEMR